MTAEEIKSCRVSQASFSRVVGVSRTRIRQLIDAGLIRCDDDGLSLVVNLRNYYGYQQVKGYYSLAEYVRRFVKKS